MGPTTMVLTNTSDPSCIDGADTAWVLVSFVLVLSMFPGLALFEAGLLRAKNTLSVMIQVMAGMFSLCVLFDIIGYSLIFGSDHFGIIGGFDHVVLINTGYATCTKFAPTIPAAAFATFQMLFAAITPLLMTGSYAERLRFWPFLAFTILWEIFVYYPVAHWVWGGGWLEKFGTLDFAGGIVVHTTAGAASTVCAIMLGRRKDFAVHHNGEFPPSSMPLAVVGAGMLLCGWFGFNAGSSLKSGALSTSTVMSTQIAACTCAMVWLILSASLGASRAPTLAALINGAIAGLAGITPASGYVDNQGSLGIGVVLGFGTFAGSWALKNKLKIDDALEVTSVHGLSGVIGSIATGLVASKDANPNLVHEGLFYGGGPKLLYSQLVGIGVVAVYSTVITIALMWSLEKAFIKFTGHGMRATEAEEALGLDISEHHEVAYHDLIIDYDGHAKLETNMPSHFGKEQTQARRKSLHTALNKKYLIDNDDDDDVENSDTDFETDSLLLN
eukprot:m.172159 g.172159  ORF g.172159 m.172159 type:complete len:500 (+) comp31671_c0_seq2:235-1734(+)